MMNLRDRLNKIYDKLLKSYPKAQCTLDLITPEKFLFSNILSPQCTDITVNAVVKELWIKYPNIVDLAKADIEDVKHIIKPCGMQNVKAQRLISAANLLLNDYDGVLPKNINELQKFPGIGRKTSLVIISEAFNNVEGVVIDTHNLRIAQRIGFLEKKDAKNLETLLIRHLSRGKWQMWSHLMVAHGRKVCVSRNPDCQKCPISDMCNFGRNQV